MLLPRWFSVLSVAGAWLLAGPGTPLHARPLPRYALEGHEAPVALLHAGKATWWSRRIACGSSKARA